MSSSIMQSINQIDKAIIELNLAIRRRRITSTRNAHLKLVDLVKSLKLLLSPEFVEINFTDFDRHLHFVGYFIEKKDFEWIKSNFYDILNKDLPEIKEEIFDYLIETQVQEKVKKGKKQVVIESNNVFIVHGRDHKPMKELKAMLSGFGLNPIVLHEQPSGSRTVIEKLENQAGQCGFAFVILTPDDRGGYFERKMLGGNILDESHFRARQNVILELGYFLARLGRDRVCCLYTGDVDLPSDVHGIVYVQFRESVEEKRDMIIKELKEAGYEL